MVRSPVEICLGTSPSQAAKSRPLLNTSPAPIAATIALEMIGPTPGTLISRSQPASCRAMASISSDSRSTRSSSRRQSPARSSIMRNMRGDRTSGGVARMRQLGAQEPLSLPHRNAALQQEGADLIDDAGALADQPLPHPVQGLQVELIRGLRGHELHRRPLHRLSDCLGIAEVILLSLGIGTNILRRHQPGIVAQCPKFATEMMRADAGFHPDQAWRHIGKTALDLATRPFLTQHNRATLIVAHDVERVLADIDTNHGNCSVEGLVNAVPLVLVPLASLSLAGREHGRTIPLTDSSRLRDKLRAQTFFDPCPSKSPPEQ